VVARLVHLVAEGAGRVRLKVMPLLTHNVSGYMEVFDFRLLRTNNRSVVLLDDVPYYTTPRTANEAAGIPDQQLVCTHSERLRDSGAC
jgi:hypothetical protein